MDDEKLREYYCVLNDVWKFLKTRLLRPDDPKWDNDKWWDCVMSEMGQIYRKHKGKQTEYFANKMSLLATEELQRICRARHIQDGEKKE